MTRDGNALMVETEFALVVSLPRGVRSSVGVLTCAVDGCRRVYWELNPHNTRMAAAAADDGWARGPGGWRCPGHDPDR